MEDFNFEKQLILCQEDLMKAALILLPDMDDAKDLLQDTMLKALDNKESYSVDANFKGWLYIIMHNLFYNRCRSKKRKPSCVRFPIRRFMRWLQMIWMSA